MMNGVTRIVPQNVTVEDDPEPGDPPPRQPSPPLELIPPPTAFVTPPPAAMELSSPAPSSAQAMDVDTGASEQVEYITASAYTNMLIRQATLPILAPDMEDFGIPPSPSGSPDPALSHKLQEFQQLRERGVYFNDKLGVHKSFRNPRLLEKLRGYAGIEDQYGSHLPKSLWNPHGFSEDQYYDKLGIHPSM